MYKFVLFIAMLFALALGGCSGGSDSPGENGDPVVPVDPVDPVVPVVSQIITTFEELKNISPQRCGEDLILGNDITVNEEWTGMCADGFTGSFDGGNFTITFNEKINGGMFANIEGGKVENLNIVANKGVIGIYLEKNGMSYGGALAGYAEGPNPVSNCSATVTGDIMVTDDYNAQAGGLIGGSMLDIINSYAIVDGNITAKSTLAPLEAVGTAAGGLAGSNTHDTDNAKTDNSFAYVTGQISAEAVFGGLAGGLAGVGDAINNSFAIVEGGISAKATEYAASGGIVGQTQNSLSHSFAVVHGSITAEAETESYFRAYTGGVTGYSLGSIISGCVIVLRDGIGSMDGYIGDVVGYGDSLINNYIFSLYGMTGSQAGWVMASDLRAADWWENDSGFSDEAWQFNEGSAPVQAVYGDLFTYVWPYWVEDY